MTNETEKLIEEAERLSDAATPGPWCHNHYGVNNWPGPDAPTRIMELLHNQDDDGEQNYRDAEFIARARTMVPELAAAIRRAETERDEALKQSAGWEIQAQDLRDRLVKAEAERDAQHDLVLRLTAERDAVSVVHACPPKGSGVMPCCGATPFEKQGERLTTNPALVTCDRQRLAADLDEARAQVWGLMCVVGNFVHNGGH